jgi:hypothetical protein
MKWSMMSPWFRNVTRLSFEGRWFLRQLSYRCFGDSKRFVRYLEREGSLC